MNLFDEDNEYIYANDKLTGKLLQYILEYLYGNGTEFTKVEAIETIKKFHAENGGEPYIGTDKQLGGCWDDAFKRLREGKGTHDPKAVGDRTWRLEKRNIEEISSTQDIEDISVNRTELTVDWPIYGKGDEAIYVFSFPLLLEAAKLGLRPDCSKIGKASKSVLDRVKAQMNSSTYEQPKILLEVRTNDSTRLEGLLHNYFKLKGKWKEDAPGTEWFYVSVDEVIEVLTTLGFIECNNSKTS